MAYEIQVRSAAWRALKRIDRQDQTRIRGVIAVLVADPRPPRMKALRGRNGFHIYVGSDCIIHKVEGDRLLIVVVTLGHRSDVYNH